MYIVLYFIWLTIKRNVNMNKKIISCAVLLSIVGVGVIQAMSELEETILTDSMAENSESAAFTPPKAFIFGEIADIDVEGFFTTFNAANVRCIQFVPFSYEVYRSGEQITVSDRYLRFLQPNLICGIFGYIGASTEPTPKIYFEKTGYEELAVAYTNSSDILWNDIAIIGSCNISELDTYVSVGDQITNCTGTIKVYYIPTDIMLGYWTFMQYSL